MIDSIPAYVWSALPDGSVDFINRRWLDFSGFSWEQGLGRDWEAAVHPDDRDRLWRSGARPWSVREGDGELKLRVRGADGQYRWLLIRNVPLQDEGGKIVSGMDEVLTSMIASGPRTQREQASLLDLTHDTILVTDMDGPIKYWNRGAEVQYGWSAEQAVGTVVHDLLTTVFPVPRERTQSGSDAHRPLGRRARPYPRRTEPRVWWRAVGLCSATSKVHRSPSWKPTATSPSASGRRRHCGEVRLIWRKGSG